MAGNPMDQVQTMTTRLVGHDVLMLRQMVVDWQREFQDLSLNESQALNAAIRLVIRTARPEDIEKVAEDRGLDEEQTKGLTNAYEWFRKEFLEVLTNVSEERKSLDGRRTRAKTGE